MQCRWQRQSAESECSAGLTDHSVLFYPTAAYAWYVARLERKAKQVLDEGERAPLLSRDGGV